jgi:hypothetical protein
MRSRCGTIRSGLAEATAWGAAAVATPGATSCGAPATAEGTAEGAALLAGGRTALRGGTGTGSRAGRGGASAGGVAWRAAALAPLLLLARGDVVISHAAGAGIQGQLLAAEPWMAVWITPHVSLHLLLYDDVLLAAVATGLALLWTLLRQPRAAAAPGRSAGGLGLALALLGPGAGCG